MHTRFAMPFEHSFADPPNPDEDPKPPADEDKGDRGGKPPTPRRQS